MFEVLMCRSSTGVEVRRPMRPVLSTKIELVAAPAVMVKGVLAPVMSSIENLLAPPLAESLAIRRQSLAGKPTCVEVSSKWIRRLFSFSRMVSKPKFSLLTQSRPTQALPWTIRSSGITWSTSWRPSSSATLAGANGDRIVPRDWPRGRAGPSAPSPMTSLPATMWKPPDRMTMARRAASLSACSASTSPDSRARRARSMTSALMAPRGIRRSSQT